MTHKLVTKVEKFQLPIAKRFGTVEKKSPYHIRLSNKCYKIPQKIKHFKRNKILMSNIPHVTCLRWFSL